MGIPKPVKFDPSFFLISFHTDKQREKKAWIVRWRRWHQKWKADGSNAKPSQHCHGSHRPRVELKYSLIRWEKEAKKELNPRAAIGSRIRSPDSSMTAKASIQIFRARTSWILMF